MDVNLISVGAGAGVAGLVVGFLAGKLTGGSAVDESGVEVGDGIELYVGNLSYDMSEKELQKIFGASGKVLSCRIITNKFNNRSKGYGFVEMASQSGADKAIKAQHGKEVMGRKMVVNEARSRSRD